MAPEIYLRKKQTEKVDIWALGILLYEMLHKKTPFKSMTVDQVKDQIVEKKIKFDINLKLHQDDKTNEIIKKDLVDLFYYCCQIDPRNRPNCVQILNHKAFNSIKPQKANH